MDAHKARACDEIDRSKEELWALSTKIWKYAEPGGKEEKTVKALVRFLKKRDFKVTERLAGLPTAFKAEFGPGEFGGKSRPNIAFICRYDAYEGRGHVTGNNLLAEIAVAAALGLQAVIRASSTRVGKVTVVGCPLSLGGGMGILVNRKVFRDVDVAFAGVPGNRTEWTPVYQARRTFKATYRTASEDSNPGQMRTDPLAAAVMSLTNVTGIQEHYGRGWKTDGAITYGGQKPTDRQDISETLVCMRAPSNKDMLLLESRVSSCLEAAATATGCELELTMAERAQYSLTSVPILIYLLQLNAYHTGLLATPLKGPKIMPPEDSGNLSHVVPMIRPMYYIGCDHDLGTKEFMKAAATRDVQAPTLALAKAFAMTAIDLWHTERALDQANQELKMALRAEKGDVYSTAPPAGPGEYVLTTDIPCDINQGWSKRP